MAKFFDLPKDPVTRFEELYEALNEQRTWWRDASPLRFAAMSALTCPGTPEKVASYIRRITDNLRKEGSLLGRLTRSLQFIIASMLLGRQDTARAFMKEVERVRKLFGKEKIRRAAVYETMCVLILRMQQDGKPVTTKQVKRLKEIYEEMKRHHWWLTGPEDLPACAILGGLDGSAEQIGRHSEDIYQALAKKHSKGDPLQTAANILAMLEDSPVAIAKRYTALAEGFRKNGVAIWQSDYDELAILTFLNQPPKRIIDCVLDHRERMKALRPRPDRSLTFNLAASTSFIQLAQVDSDLKMVTDAKALMDMQAIIQAQQAAAAAAAASAAAASSAASG